MTTPDWIISKATLTFAARQRGWRMVIYPLRVEGTNRSAESQDHRDIGGNLLTGEPFYWNVPMPTESGQDHRYDFSKAEMDAATRAALVEAGVLPAAVKEQA